MRKTVSSFAVIFQLGSIVLVATLLPLLVGLWLDRFFHTTPWVSLIAVIVGVLAAITSIYRVIAERFKP